MFSQNRLIFENHLDTPKGSPDDFAGRRFSSGGSIADSLMKESFDGMEGKAKAPTMEKLATDLYKILSTDQVAFRAVDEGMYKIISGRDGSTIGEINIVMKDGAPAIEATKFIPIKAPDSDSYTYKKETSYYKTTSDFQKELSNIAD